MEMTELRIILRDANRWSLVLGDELGASTESKSAFSIFVAALMKLCDSGCNFLFTTHFYEVLKMDEIERMRGLGLFHLEVSYDGSNLIYNRKLKAGPGISNYGLECCKTMYFKPDFMELAYGLRNKYYPELSGVLSWEKTAYNANKLKGMCQLCGTKMADEIHHIVEQHRADERGFLIKDGGFHKNVASNLLSLCEKCHLLQHGAGGVGGVS